MSPVNLSDCLHTQLGLLSPQLTSKNLSVQFQIETEDVLINANEAALNVLINNLLANAIKFSNRNGVVYLILKEGQLRVEDDGPGITAEDRDKIFDRFYRGSGASGTKGSGLGLAFAKWVAHAHNFELSVESPQVGKGAAFLLLLK